MSVAVNLCPIFHAIHWAIEREMYHMLQRESVDGPICWGLVTVWTDYRRPMHRCIPQVPAHTYTHTSTWHWYPFRLHLPLSYCDDVVLGNSKQPVSMLLSQFVRQSVEESRGTSWSGGYGMVQLCKHGTCSDQSIWWSMLAMPTINFQTFSQRHSISWEGFVSHLKYSFFKHESTQTIHKCF